MKKTKNSAWKRVAAGALSMALVAGAMPANVGGLLTGGKVLVASAADMGTIELGVPLVVGDGDTFTTPAYTPDPNFAPNLVAGIGVGNDAYTWTVTEDTEGNIKLTSDTGGYVKTFEKEENSLDTLSVCLSYMGNYLLVKVKRNVAYTEVIDYPSVVNSGDTLDGYPISIQYRSGSPYQFTISGLDNTHGVKAINKIDSTTTTYFPTNGAVSITDYMFMRNIAIVDVPAVINVPTANTLTYAGEPQALVTGGTPSNGAVMQYALGTDDTTVPTDWYDSVPEETDPDTYYVWYRAVFKDGDTVTEATPPANVVAFLNG